MQLDEKTIVSFSPQALLSTDLLKSVSNISEPVEKARVKALLEVKAKDLGIQSQYKSFVKAFNDANEALSREYSQHSEKNPLELNCDQNGKPLSTIDNFTKILENDPKFAGIKYNILTYRPEQVRNGETFQWQDGDDAEMRRYIEKKYHIHSKEKCDDAFRIICQRNQYHPIREMVKAVEWDHVSRIENFLHKWTHCEDSPYTREVSRLIFAGGIHRLFNPGVKFDDMPVLIGVRQAEGKSSLCRFLAMKDEYFTEITDFDPQKGAEAIEGAWIVEVGELLALTKAKEQEAVKSFLTRMNDRKRDAYDRRTTDHKRQCVFLGTTNKRQFLTDKTGNRRFYPVEVHQEGYDLFNHEQECREYIKQCWAEAYYRMLNGNMPPFANRDLIGVIRKKQADAAEDDYRVGMIESYLHEKNGVCALELWQKALKNGEFSKPSRKDSMELSLIMQNMDGWEKQSDPVYFPEYGTQRWWKFVRASKPSEPPF